MAVLVEAISVIVCRDAILAKYHGGWEAFVRAVHNATFCYDSELARVGFMNPQDAGNCIVQLEQKGLTFFVNNEAHDLAVADQQRGMSTDCNWVEEAEYRGLIL